jgi:ribonuclease T2
MPSGSVLRSLIRVTVVGVLACVPLVLQGCGDKSTPLVCSRVEGCNGAEAGQFQRWVFAFEWQPTWSYDACLDGSTPLAPWLKSGTFAASHLSLHGLWPEYYPQGRNGSLWPQFCVGGPAGDFHDCNPPKPDKCQVSPSTIAQFNTTDLWQSSAMEYAWGTLAAHQWSKHGSCTTWNESHFFQVTYDTYDRLRKAPGARAIEAAAGTDVPRSSIQKDFGKSAALICDDDCQLVEVWVMLEADPETHLPLGEVPYGDSASKSCGPCKTIRIPGLRACPPPPTSCQPFSMGPPCTSDAECKNFTGCVRCAFTSKHCTDVQTDYDQGLSAALV